LIQGLIEEFFMKNGKKKPLINTTFTTVVQGAPHPPAPYILVLMVCLSLQNNKKRGVGGFPKKH
jgi:hypothetical protein